MSVWRAIKMLLTLRCAESERLLSDGCDRKLSPVERWAVRLHQISCGTCRKIAKQFKVIDQVAKKRVEKTAAMSNEMRERLAASLAKKLDSNSEND